MNQLYNYFNKKHMNKRPFYNAIILILSFIAKLMFKFFFFIFRYLYAKCQLMYQLNYLVLKIFLRGIIVFFKLGFGNFRALINLL